MTLREFIVALGCLVVLSSPTFAQNTSFSLEDALIAVKSTPDWQVANLNYQSAQRNLESAQASSGINLSASGSYNLSQPVNSSATASSTGTLSVTASLTVLPWSPAYDGIRSAQRALQRAELDLRDAQNSLSLSAISSYFAARIATFDVTLSEDNQKLSEALLRVTNLKYKNGQTTITDVLTAEQNLANAQSTLLNAQNTVQINFASLGVNPGTTLSTAATNIELPPGTPEVLVSRALERRSDVLKAHLKLQDAEDALRNAQRDRLVPNASLNLGYGQPTGGANISSSLNFQTGIASVTGTVPVTATSSNGTAFSVSVSASFPILAPTSDAKINTAQTSLAVAKASLETTKRTAALDVLGRYSEMMTARSRVKVAMSALETAQKTLETASARNQAGLNTALEVQQSTLNLAQANRDLENANVNAMISTYKLQIATGLFRLVPQGDTK
jgi:outer membrane protein TolC